MALPEAQVGTQLPSDVFVYGDVPPLASALFYSQIN